MAIQHANRGIVKKDLQLYYNREWYKSFKGESRINLLWGGHFPDGYGMPQEAGSNPTNQIIYYPENPSPYSDYVLRSTALGGNLFTEYQLNVYTIEPSATYCLSAWYAQDSAWNGSNREIFHCRIFATSGNHVTTGGGGTLIKSVNIGGLTWEYRFITINSPADATGYMEWYVGYPSSNTAGFRYYTNLQLEKGTYATPYNDIANNINVRNITTTNLLISTYSSLPTNWSVDGSGQGTIGTYSYIENNSAIRIVDVNSNTRFNTGIISGFSASTNYTFSVKYRKVSGTPTLRFQLQFYNSSNGGVGSVSFPTTSQIYVYDKDGWQLAWYTVTSPASTAKVLWFIQDGDDYTTYNHTYDLKEPQIQTGTVPTAWTSNTATANTLTSGGGLLDISGNNYNIDLTSAAIAFDSGGYYFNANAAGALTTPVANSILDSLSNNTHTYECWIKLLGTPPGASDGYFFGRQGFHEGYAQFKSPSTTFGALSWYFDNGNTGWLSYAGALNTWYHTAYVVDVENSIRYLYVNGVLNSSGALTKQLKQYSSGTVYQLGSANPDYASNSIVSTARAYNRALTATEILQNFNATRKTYGI